MYQELDMLCINLLFCHFKAFYLFHLLRFHSLSFHTKPNIPVLSVSQGIVPSRETSDWEEDWIKRTKIESKFSLLGEHKNSWNGESKNALKSLWSNGCHDAQSWTWLSDQAKAIEWNFPRRSLVKVLRHFFIKCARFTVTNARLLQQWGSRLITIN